MSEVLKMDTPDSVRAFSPFSPSPHVHTGLDGAAFACRMPANKLTQMEAEIFFDIAHGSQSAIMEFLYIRNKLLQAWLADPTVELTTEKAQAAVILPQAGRSNCS